MIQPIKVPVQVEVMMHIKQAQILPILGLKPMRSSFDMEQYDKVGSRSSGGPSRYRQRGYDLYGQPVKGEDDFNKLLNWAKSGRGLTKPVLELHLPTHWADLKKKKQEFLANPKYETALHFVGGKRFNQITGHPDGTEIWVIDDVLYRVMTWRSITQGYWDKKKNRDSKILWRTADEVVYFLCKCEKINEEPLKSTIVDTIGLELLERDKPKPQLKESILPF